MTRGKGTKILSISEREALVGDKKEAEAQLKEMESGEFGKGTSAEGMDRDALKRRVAHLEKVIHDGLAPKVRGVTKDEMVKEAQMLREQIQDGMPTKYEMDFPHLCPGAIHKHINWEKRTHTIRERYREIMRTLESQDPTAVDVEKLRKEK